MFDIPSYCEAREKELQEAGISIVDVLARAKVDRSSWTGWKYRGVLPRMSKLKQLDAEIDKALASRRPAPREAAE